MAPIKDILSTLFSRRIVVKRVAGDMLKTIDLNMQQKTGTSKTAYDPRTRWRRGASTSGWGTTSIPEIEAIRLQLYSDYESMESDGILSSAMDVYADECTTVHDTGELIKIETSNPSVKKVLHNLLYDILNVDYNFWSWTRNTVKYGDYFLILNLEDGIGITDVTPCHPALLRREEDESDKSLEGIRFVLNTGNTTMSVHTGMGETFAFYEIAHFRLLTDTNYMPYGKSVVEPARKEFKKLTLQEDAMLIQRIMRAPERRIFKIDVGNIAPHEVDQHVQSVVDEMKKTPYIDPITGDYNLRFNIQNMTEDFFLPVRGQESGTDVDVLQGLSSEGTIEDIEYTRNKMMAALKIPKAFLGYDEGVEGKATLAAEDIRFARTVVRIQNLMVAELYKMALIHLKAQGFESEECLDFELSLNNPSTLYQRQQIDLLSEKMALAADMMESKLFSRQHIYEKLFLLSPEEWQAQQQSIIEDAKFALRLEQIESEGNDPEETGEVVGTPYNLAALHKASQPETPEGSFFKPDYSKRKDKRHDNKGRPKEIGSYGRHRDQAWGRDPIGQHAGNPKIKMEILSKVQALRQKRKGLVKG